MNRANAVRGRAPWAGLAVLALLPAAMALIGCRSEPERVALPRPQMMARRSKDYWRSVFIKEAASWATLEADCDVSIYSPQIPGVSQAVHLTGGLLVVQKPNQVYLRVPASGRLRLLLVGDGQAYRADIPVFGDAYAGTYDDPVIPQAGRIHIMPADIAHAFCPYELLVNRILVLTEWERVSKISALTFIEEEEIESEVKMASTITLDRGTEMVAAIEKFGPDGGLRAGISFPRRTAVTVSEDRSVRVPTQVLLDYPGERTRVMLSLDKVKLNVRPDQSIFLLGP